MCEGRDTTYVLYIVDLAVVAGSTTVLSTSFKLFPIYDVSLRLPQLVLLRDQPIFLAQNIIVKIF